MACSCRACGGGSGGTWLALQDVQPPNAKLDSPDILNPCASARMCSATEAKKKSAPLGHFELE